MRFALPIVLLSMLVAVSDVGAAEPTTRPARRGSSAASLATAYSGPVRFTNLRVLAAERAANTISDPTARAAHWRYYYEYPYGCYYNGGYGYYGWGWGGWCGYRGCFTPYITTVAYRCVY